MDPDIVPLPDEFHRKIGEGRREVLRILSEAEKPKRIGIVFRDAGLNMDSRTTHFNWLTGEKADRAWWPDGIGALIEVAERSDDTKNERKLALTEDGEQIVHSLREIGEIQTSEDVENIKMAQETIRNRLDDLEKNGATRGEQLNTIGENVDKLEERVKELEGINKKLDTLREEIADVNEKLD